MKSFIYITVIVLFLSACSTSSIDINKDNELNLCHDNLIVKLANEVIDKESQWFENLDIKQYKLKKDNSVLFYENIEVGINWEFKYGPITTLKYIFDATKADVLYQDSAISFICLQISKTQHINILMESSSFSAMSYIYGFSDKRFIEIIKPYKKSQKLSELSKRTSQKSLDVSTPHMSKWSVQMLFLQALLKPTVRTGSNF